MTTFEWAVLVLLVFIWLKPSPKPEPDSDTNSRIITLLGECAEHLRMIRHTDLDNVQAQLSSIESDVRFIMRKYLSEIPNDEPHWKHRDIHEIQGGDTYPDQPKVPY